MNKYQNCKLQNDPDTLFKLCNNLITKAGDNKSNHLVTKFISR